jgi:hypothetical protein
MIDYYHQQESSRSIGIKRKEKKGKKNVCINEKVIQRIKGKGDFAIDSG